MRKLTIVLGVAAALVAGSVATASAQRRGGGPGDGPGFGGPGDRRQGIDGPRRPGRPFVRARLFRGFRQLDLSADQKTKVREILEKSRLEVAPLMKQLQEKRRVARTAIQAGTAPEAARAEIRTSTEALRKQIGDAREKTRAEVRSVLTPEQLAKLPNRRR